MSEIEQLREEVEQFLSETEMAFEMPVPAPMSFFVKELGWIHARFAVPVMSTDGTSYMDIISVDGSFHQIKEESIIDKRTTKVTPDLLEQFMRMLGESMQTVPEGTTMDSEMFG